MAGKAWRASMLAASLAGALALTGCGGAGDEKGGAASDVVTIGTSSVIKSDNPLDQSWSTYNFAVFDSLLKAGDEDFTEGGLATKWKIDGKTLTFTVRKGVKFQNGEALTAHDVAFSLNLTKKEGYAFSQNLDTFVSAKAKDDTTLIVTMTATDPLGVQKVGMVPVVPRDYWEAKGLKGFLAKPIGSGPYRVLSYSPESGYDFEAHDGYWGKKPPTRRVNLRFYKDPQALESALLSGQIQVAQALSASSAPNIKTNASLELHAGYMGNTTMLQLNTTKAPFDDSKARRAANLALDQAALVKTITHGTSEAEDGQVTFKGVAGYVADLHSQGYDPDEAKKLLASSSYDGEEVRFVGTTLQQPLMEAVAGSLNEVGFKVKVEALDVPVWLEQFRNGSDAQIFARGMSYSGINDASRAYRWLATVNKPFVKDREWLDLWKAQSTERDHDARVALLEKATRMVNEKDYILFTYSQSSPNATVKGVDGIRWLNPAMDFTGITYQP
ncbi:ABC transporter substrate-binding protein [Streptomyces sp. NPDC052042]|uniref:ABC transporter substrate-binding protein n=1 Tax=Streptomyces sp. NPDC052042 TaxID=3365683 RepID=UPI0037D88F46